MKESVEKIVWVASAILVVILCIVIVGALIGPYTGKFWAVGFYLLLKYLIVAVLVVATTYLAKGIKGFESHEYTSISVGAVIVIFVLNIAMVYNHGKEAFYQKRAEKFNVEAYVDPTDYTGVYEDPWKVLISGKRATVDSEGSMTLFTFGQVPGGLKDNDRIRVTVKDVNGKSVYFCMTSYNDRCFTGYGEAIVSRPQRDSKLEFNIEVQKGSTAYFEVIRKKIKWKDR